MSYFYSPKVYAIDLFAQALISCPYPEDIAKILLHPNIANSTALGPEIIKATGRKDTGGRSRVSTADGSGIR